MERTLRIDIDLVPSHRWMQDWVEKCIILCWCYGLTVSAIRKCKSAHKGIHVEVDIDPPVRATTAVRLQWLLNDDPNRTLRNMARVCSGCKRWNRLFAEYPHPRWITIYRRVPNDLKSAFSYGNNSRPYFLGNMAFLPWPTAFAQPIP
jgi:hypothetical protein